MKCSTENRRCGASCGVPRGFAAIGGGIPCPPHPRRLGVMGYHHQASRRETEREKALLFWALIKSMYSLIPAIKIMPSISGMAFRSIISALDSGDNRVRPNNKTHIDLYPINYSTNKKQNHKKKYIHTPPRVNPN
ncbi:hypothetical protein [Serratia rubidaea]|uniref:hypothetical protein n=1 Tax=Serratia rubidaea TaxID=61652 RepID=UPI00128FC78C|nr:hypothetical protein [Serratia rubidaea]MBS0974599.1 hypothetical protein [Serratia rubidaea]QPR65017.1 hypothetical protein I6G83_07150 [Serratia rubidaea]HAY0637801.1 hypothetical protein [Serratia rubidaea]